MKKKLSKKYLALMLSFVIVFTSVFGVALYTYAYKSEGNTGNLHWTVSDNETVLTISGTGYSPDYTLALTPWYGYRSKIKTVVVQEGVQGLGDNAFYGTYNSLVRVVLPSTLVKLGENCFRNCKVLNDIEIPEGCNELYSNVFYGCASLKQITIPSGNTATEYKNKVPSGFFKGCTNLERVVLSKRISSLMPDCFENCTSLKTLVWSSNAFSTPSAYPFSNAANLTIYAKTKAELMDDTIFDYIVEQRGSGSYPKIYCYNDIHHYSTKTNGTKCDRCDKKYGERIISPLDGHNYSYQYCNGDYMLYNCDHCGTNDICFEIEDVLNSFDYVKADGVYDGRFDIIKDGVINSKDYSAIHNIMNNIETGYEMKLTNENATQQAKNLFDYMKSVYKTNVITGQQESTWVQGADYEINYIYNNTGKKPAIRGFDFMGDDFKGVTSRAKSWASQGGIVSICWHCSSTFDKSYDQCKADELTQAQWDAIFTTGSSENTKFLNGMKKAGSALQELQKAGVPVLWRPFHEFDGGWFWWGKGGSENFVKLWQMMYNYYTYDLGLNNLIWVLGYSHNSYDYGNDISKWYPGNQYVDIIGADSYEVSQNGPEGRLYYPVKKICKNTKMIVLHETGKIPTESQFKAVPWGYFLTWHTTYLTETNSIDDLKALYNSDYAITLDELPSFK